MTPAVVGIIVAANALRAGLLFFPEAGVWPISETTHGLIGVVFFILGLLGIGGVYQLGLWWQTSEHTRRVSVRSVV